MIEKMKFSELANQIRLCIVADKYSAELKNGFTLYCRTADSYVYSEPDYRVFDLEYGGEVKKSLYIFDDSYNKIVEVLKNNREYLIKLGFVDDISDVSY
ncbi:hypothetical protein CQA57_07010 [Helicobacter anseris]|uniref:Uncharacterized protein n=1 Tax=Helicobacter anseris TaxID=375926 RepID=A0A3D8J5C4_9HELI|nr:hypothetical protein [Helicobacter anseris]RDU72345.1 hypothetical protein CQA57_07010 [Helicobacter anseris]